MLRHRPALGGLALDERGSAPIEEVRLAADRAMPFPVERRDIEALCEPPTDPRQKQRFVREGDFVRAGHGHSVPISDYTVTTPAARLFHATPRITVPAIRRDGLRSMKRDKVHLATDVDITHEAARRRSREVVVIEVRVSAALEAGVQFYESADPRVVLSDDVPATYLIFEDEPTTP
jgi:putative RNA 2'-phosphotransferase